MPITKTKLPNLIHIDHWENDDGSHKLTCRSIPGLEIIASTLEIAEDRMYEAIWTNYRVEEPTT